jgi:hypothetical protein
MKKIIFYSFLLASTNTFAQFSLDKMAFDTVVTKNCIDGVLDLKNNIQNTSTTDSIVINWSMDNRILSNSWPEIQICDPKDCYPNVFSQTFKLFANQKGLFDVKVVHEGKNGDGSFEVNYVNALNPAQSKKVTYKMKVDCASSSIAEISHKSGSYKMNGTTIEFLQEAMIKEVAIYNVNGQKIATVINQYNIEGMNHQLLIAKITYVDQSHNLIKIAF